MLWCWSLGHGFLLFSALLPLGPVMDWEDLGLRRAPVTPCEGSSGQVAAGHPCPSVFYSL